MAMQASRRADAGGFTLIEILISMMFLSLGIMGVIAFFFLGAADSREAVRSSRTTLIAKQVRQGLLHALRYPLQPDEVQGLTTPAYRFELPSVQEVVSGLPDNVTRYEFQNINGFYFYIDSETQNLPSAMSTAVLADFNNTNEPIERRVLDLPYEASETVLGTPIGEYTWRLRDTFKEDPSFPDFEQISPYNEDDSHLYSFRILLRRGPSASGDASGRLKPGDLLAVTVYVFRQFNDDVVNNTSGYEWLSYDSRTGDALYTTAGGDPVDRIQPLATFHFYIGGM